jgi:hypothetical protein
MNLLEMSKEMNEKRLPLLIAQQKNARFLKDDYKLGWLFQDNTGYLWTVWGSSNNFENAMKVAKQVINEQGDRTVYISKTPLERDKAIYEPLTLEEIKL